MSATLDLLHDNRLLRGCPEDVLARIEPLVEKLTLPPQEIVFRRGDAGDAMFLVLTGAVRLSVENPQKVEETVAMVAAGEFFGDMALLDHEPHVVQATTVGPATLGRIGGAEIEEILRLAPHVVPLNFVRTVHARIKESHRHFTEEILRGERLYHVGTMTGAIIHDFKNPLTAIQCACDLLETRDHDETHRRVAEIIKRSVERMMGMTQELLDYTLGGSAPLKFEPISVGGIIAGLEEQCLGDLPRRGITVEKHIDYEGKIEVDVLRFERVLLNIIKNAREAMPRGGRLRLAVYASGEWLVFEIEDTGKGMSPEVAAMIFEPFFTHGKPEGTGLGMPMARSVVDAHQGTISVESERGKGTKFVVKAPLRKAGEAKTVPPPK
jgi:signal transduction histidine kinase